MTEQKVKWETRAEAKRKAELLLVPKGIDVVRHSKICTICKHEQKEDLEEAYLTWEPIMGICEQYGVAYKSLNQHVKVLGLDMKKLKNRKRLYLKVMESVQLGDVSASEAIAASKLLEQLEGRISNEPLSEEERAKRYQEIEDKIRKVEPVA